MNIFYLDKDIRTNARMHIDKHIVKMPIEYAQLLSTCLILVDRNAPYQKTHEHHPCTKWMMENSGNYSYVYDLAYAVGLEYYERYGRLHRSTLVLRDIPRKVNELKYPGLFYKPKPPNVSGIPKEFIEKYRLTCVSSYRLCYLTLKFKFSRYKHPASYPNWWVQEPWRLPLVQELGREYPDKFNPEVLYSTQY